MLSQRKLILHKVLILILSLIFVACAEVDSQDVKTRALYVQQSVEENEGSTRATVYFSVGGQFGTTVRLAGGDEIRCNGNVLNENETLLGVIYYHGNCGSLVEGGDYEFDFVRVDEDQGILHFSSNVLLPSAPTITSPGEGVDFNRGDTIDLNWTTSDFGKISIELIGTGLRVEDEKQSTYSRFVRLENDSGTYSMDQRWTDPSSFSGDISSVSIQVTRSIYRALNNGLKGSISGSWTSTVSNIRLLENPK